ncbi:MAG TPA: CPBP family intramembrane glutamic endopeptidase [Microbacteriaceae bacterium]|nr:CPBP family intramembrane glutamic endopeptidase [Microbacteriaceae bacterium]
MNSENFNPVKIRWEIVIVLALSFGASGVYAVVNIIERLTREVALSSQTATINRPLADRPGFDLTYQLLAFLFGLAPVFLVCYLVWQESRPHLIGLGFGHTGSSTPKWWAKELFIGFALAAAIGVPGLAFYIATKTIGINVTVIPTALDAYWWTVPVLVLQALRAALGEELIVVAYLFNRLKLLGWGPVAIIVASSLLRGSYHLYQGFGGFLGNVVMGLVFGWIFYRWGRVLPLIVAHWLLDIVSFAGFPIALALWPNIFGS